MIDFHTHVLPGMDDGSKDVDTSLEMLEISAGYGVDEVAATSHFYAEDNSLQKFLARRREAYESLAEAMEGRPGLPRLRLGAEVYYFRGVSAIENLESLCLEGTNLLLLEMPFSPWTDRMLQEVEAIRQTGLQPVAAHIERYMSIQSRKTMSRFFDLDVLIQCNASFFLSRKTARRALGMLKAGSIHFLGSDTHNLTTRSPNLGAALAIIEKKLGQGALDRLAANEEFFISESEDLF